MIELTPLARPYAKALFEASLDLDTMEETSENLKTIAVVSQTNEVAALIENPTYSRKEISEKIINLFDDTVNTSSKTLLKLLAENKRLNLISSISEIYQQLLEKHNKQKSIKVFVAKDPSDEAKINIEEKLKSSYGKDAKISFSKDPNIMGGLSIKIGDETLDLSIRGKVKKLINQLNF